MLSDKMKSALNEQINAEFYAFYTYLAMAAYFEAENLPGFANWMHVQSDEERGHAMKIYSFVNECNSRVTLKAIDAPPATWDSPLAAFEAAFQQERKVTKLIDNLVDLALSERDHASNSFLQWFVDEQVEELAVVDGVIQDLKRIGDSPQGLFLLDRELGGRAGGGAE